MDAEPDLSRLARTVGEPTRMRMLTLLMAGRALTAKELAYGAGVEPATGSAHLQRLLADALVVVRSQGRHRYYQLASPEVAHCIEALLAIAPRSTGLSRSRPPLHWARLCYDHLAGWLGTEITRLLLERALIQPRGSDFAVSRKGERWFAALGIPLDAVRQRRRKFACSCLDWSERREHLGGALGAAFAGRLLAAGWLQRRPDTRALAVPPHGREALSDLLGLRWPAAADGDHVDRARPLRAGIAA